RMLLARQMLVLGHAGIFVGLRIVDYPDGLAPPPVQGDMLERERTVGELSVPVAKKFVDGPGKDHASVPARPLDVAILGVEHDLDIRVIEDALEHRGVIPASGDLQMW